MISPYYIQHGATNYLNMKYLYTTKTFSI